MPIFENEAEDMAPVAIRELSNVFSKTVIVREHQRRHKRTDMLLVHLDWDAVQERRQRTSDKPLESGERTTYDELSTRTPCQFESLESYFLGEYNDAFFDSIEYEHYSMLQEYGYLKVNDENIVHTVDYPNIIDSLTAIELKRSRVEVGIEQAEERLNYANQSYVMVDESHTRSSLKKQDEFEATGIGLMSLTRDELEILIEPSREERHGRDYRTLEELSYATVAANEFESIDGEVPPIWYRSNFDDVAYLP